ncbi:hypothetical protein PSCICJ_40990 [Pseudomonas cichorii]|nr:hypothetical protein PSCICJ_40990 [Pseudomonas cichorii]
MAGSAAGSDSTSQPAGQMIIASAACAPAAARHRLMNKDLHGKNVMIGATQYRKLEILSLSPATSKGRSTF